MNRAAVVSRTTLAEQLRRLGLAEGTLVMVHASLRRVGPIEGRAEALIQALLDVLGGAGTLLMVLGADPREPFDALSTPADPDIGALAEAFRTWPGVEIEDHAASRYAALGPRAGELLRDTPLHDYHGTGSVLNRLTDSAGSVLRLGADPDTVTLTHYAEYLARLPRKRRVRRCYVRADTGEQWLDSLDDSDGIVDWEGEDYFVQLLQDFLAAGGATVGSVGHATAELFPARPYVEFATAWMEDHLASASRRLPSACTALTDDA